PVAEALDLLARLHRRRNWRPVVETVNELLEATRAHAGFALRPAGNQALANVYRVCDLARTFELTGGISFRGFVEDLAEQAERERDLAVAVRVSYVAATRARDLLVVPAVGDGPYEGWLNPLNLAIYPPPERRRQAENSPRCPAFGSDSVVERPFECDEPPQSS